MGNTIVHGLPHFETVAASGVGLTLSNAVAGTVIDASAAAGSPITMYVNNARKRGNGVCVHLHPDQKYMLDARADCGIWVTGGHLDSDAIVGETDSSRAFEMRDNAKRIGISEARFGKSAIQMYSRGGFEDVSVTKSVYEFGRGDMAQLRAGVRFDWDDIILGEEYIAYSMCWFNDGSDPVYGISGPACTGMGGTWRDSAHADVGQFVSGLTDGRMNNIRAYRNGQGIGMWTGETEAQPWTNGYNRVAITNCDIRAYAPGVLIAGGTDIEVTNNIFGVIPGLTAPFNMQVFVTKLAPESTLRLGANTLGPTTFAYIPAGYSMTGPINGDAVLPPEPPRFRRADWFPRAPMPTITPRGIPISTDGGLVLRGGTAVGDWVSIDYASWTSMDQNTFAFRHLRNGVAIPGATGQIRQLVAEDTVPGTQLQAEIIATNNISPSLPRFTSVRTAV